MFRIAPAFRVVDYTRGSEGVTQQMEFVKYENWTAGFEEVETEPVPSKIGFVAPVQTLLELCSSKIAYLASF